MYFQEFNALYLHPGKTAGTSIENTILSGKRDPGIADLECLFGWDGESGIYLQHATAQCARQLLGKEKFDQAFKFMTVRDPFARMVSVYHYTFPHNEKSFGGFRPFILSLPTLVSNRTAINGDHFSPQYLFATIEDEPVCDVILRFESLNQGFDQVAQALKTNWSLQNLHPYRYHSFPSGELSKLYDDEMIKAMQIAYTDDFRFFNYPNTPQGVLE